MIYACDKCRFLFERIGAVKTCPDCGKPTIREATETEQAAYLKSRAESQPNAGSNADVP